jgi:acid phosphatase
MILTRRHFISSAALSGATAALSQRAAAQQAGLNFVLIGDWGRRGADHQAAVAAQMGKSAAELGSAFTISVGDNFYENGVTSLTDPQWRQSYEQVYTAPALQSPWKVLLGNHDYRGNVEAQLAYAHHSPRWQMPARYWSETHALPGGATAAFYFLDTSPFIAKYYGSNVRVEGQNPTAQLAWLDTALAASQAEWNIVIGHHPIYTAIIPAADPDHDHDQPDLIAHLLPILQRHKVPVYICGHDHTLQSVHMAGLTHIVTGAGSQTYQPPSQLRPQGFASGAHGFMAASLSAGMFHYSLIDEHGASLFAQTITRV